MAADKYRPHDPAEYAKLLEWAKGSSSILEIGSRYGYTLCELAHGTVGKRRVVSVDLPAAGDWGTPDSEPVLRAHVAGLRTMGYDAHLFIGDSNDPDIVMAVRELGPFDFAFIDGDHRYQGVMVDWQNYGPFAKRVAFHDIVRPAPSDNQNLEVWRLWQEIKAKHTTQEFIAPGSKMGVGLVG